MLLTKLVFALVWPYRLGFALSTSTNKINNSISSSGFNSRHVCLFHDYSILRGPHFNALFDELLQEQQKQQQQFDCKRRIALCSSKANGEKVAEKLLPAIQQDLLEQTTGQDSDVCKHFILDNYNPISLEEEIEEYQPSILWVVDDDAFRIRYKMRTSGLDSIVARLCGPPRRNDDNGGGSGGENDSCCLYVGENGGAIASGASMATAHASGHDPKQAPEPQFAGLGLLGPQRSISFGIDLKELEQHPKVTQEDLMLLALQEEQVFCWSQHDTSTTSFIFLPTQKGMLEQWSSPPPVPPLIEDDEHSVGGVVCRGEPSIDPSRMMQQVGDSEWANEIDT